MVDYLPSGCQTTHRQPLLKKVKNMKDSLASISFGSVSTVLVSISGANILEAVIVAFIGGVVGYLAKLACELVVKKLFKRQKNEK